VRRAELGRAANGEKREMRAMGFKGGTQNLKGGGERDREAFIAKRKK